LTSDSQDERPATSAEGVLGRTVGYRGGKRRQGVNPQKMKNGGAYIDVRQGVTAYATRKKYQKKKKTLKEKERTDKKNKKKNIWQHDIKV